MNLLKTLLLIAFLLLPPSLQANDLSRSVDGLWIREQELSKGTTPIRTTDPVNNQPDVYLEKSFFSADTSLLKQTLSQAPLIHRKNMGHSGIILSLPLSNGNFINVQAYQYNMMAPELERTFPDIKTYKVYDTGNNKFLGHIDITPRGFHGMIQSNEDFIYIDPLRTNSTNVKNEIPGKYQSFKIKNKRPYQCTLLKAPEAEQLLPGQKLQARQNGSLLKKYRLAVTTTGEYSAAVSTDSENPSSAEAQAAIVTAINRVNQIYSRDFAIQLDLVAGNQDLIFLDADNDPFNGDANHDIDIITTEINKIITSDDYDLGHLFTLNGGGLAFFQSACNNNIKAGALTGVGEENLETDAFYVDYVAHELGHQFGANHTFNGTSGSCGGNRNAATAFEPGSGSTIMAYAGICGAQNLQATSDPYFHSGSIDEVLDFIESDNGGCFYSSISTGDNLPTVDAGNNYHIPAQTPFMLTASASDVDGDNIHYTWEQMDTGLASSTIGQMNSDGGNRPLFRSFFGDNNPVRFFPKFEKVITNNLEASFGETLPTTNRLLNFRVTARSDDYGLDSDNQQITVHADSGPFRVVQPQQNTYHFESQDMVVLWNVANTTEAPISCNQVDILLATDGGPDFNSFAELLANVENNGSATVTLPAGLSNSGRILIRCSDNIFFNINEGNFNIIDSENTLISIHNTTPSLKERNVGRTIFTFILSRTGNTSSNSSVNFTINGFGNNPANKNDFSSTQPLSGTINFANDEVEKAITISVKGDTQFEKDESFVVTLGNAMGGFISIPDAKTSIRNDDIKTTDTEEPTNTVSKKSSGSLAVFQIILLLITGLTKVFINTKKILLFSIFITVMNSCSQQQTAEYPQNEIEKQSSATKGSKKPQVQVQLLLWVKTADVDADFKNNARTPPIRYWAYYSRQGLQFPGLNPEQSAFAAQGQYRIQEGMGDVIFSTEHLDLRKKFTEYATRYNQLVDEQMKR